MKGIAAPSPACRMSVTRGHPRAVVGACPEGRFAVWPVETVDAAVALLTGRESGVRRPDGRFSEGTVNAGVEAVLERFAEIRHSFSGRGAALETPPADGS